MVWMATQIVEWVRSLPEIWLTNKTLTANTNDHDELISIIRIWKACSVMQLLTLKHAMHTTKSYSKFNVLFPDAISLQYVQKIALIICHIEAGTIFYPISWLLLLGHVEDMTETMSAHSWIFHQWARKTAVRNPVEWWKISTWIYLPKHCSAGGSFWLVGFIATLLAPVWYFGLTNFKMHSKTNAKRQDNYDLSFWRKCTEQMQTGIVTDWIVPINSHPFHGKSVTTFDGFYQPSHIADDIGVRPYFTWR
jgi:hypothetical protein